MTVDGAQRRCFSEIGQVFVGLVMIALICVPFYWNYVLGLATMMRRKGGVLDDGELGLDEMHLPADDLPGT